MPSRSFRATLKDATLTGATGRVGVAGDNAAMKSFFSLIQKNALDRYGRATRAQIRSEFVDRIGHTDKCRCGQRGACIGSTPAPAPIPACASIIRRPPSRFASSGR